MLPNPQPYFAELTDPWRETKNKLHLLDDIVMIVLCAALSGGEDWMGAELGAYPVRVDEPAAPGDRSAEFAPA